MSRYQRYPAYKDSGLEWIGEIPKHWEVTKIRFYYDVQLGKMLQPESKTDSDVEIKYLKAQHVQWNQINHDDLPTMWATEREIEKFSVQQGDLLICEGGEVGRSALLVETMDVCIIQNALHRVRAKEKTCVKYLQYFMQHVSNALWFDILCNKATIAHLTGEKLAALEFPLPPLEEQQAIASFLDRKTAEIDELITKKETLLKKLDEKRTALITQAVTKGLDPSAPMKDSGVEWLGEIPGHWKSTKIRFYYNVQLGKMLQPEPSNKNDVEVKYLKAQHVQWNQINHDDLPTMWATEREIEKFSVQQGDLLICEGGEVGRSALLVETMDVCIIQNALHRVRATEKSCVKFLQYFTQHVSNTQWFDILCNKATIAHLTGEKLAALEFPLPPLEEQQAIAEHIDKKTATIDRQKAQVTEAIERLKEYRSALITDAVTGKMDVHSHRTKESLSA